jgi:ammonia channel protein AmtB
MKFIKALIKAAVIGWLAYLPAVWLLWGFATPTNEIERLMFYGVTRLSLFIAAAVAGLCYSVIRTLQDQKRRKG